MILEKFQTAILWIWEQLMKLLYTVYHVPMNISQYLGYKAEDVDCNHEGMQRANKGSVDEHDNVFRRRILLPRKRMSKDFLNPKNESKHDYQKATSTVERHQDRNEESVETRLGTGQYFGDTQDIYKLQNPYCIVIANINFREIMAPRNGGNADVKNIKKLLRESARFKTVITHTDCTRMQVLKIIEDAAKSEEIRHHDGFVCFISSHGSQDGIRTVDRNGHVTVDELTTRLNGKQCKALRGKPKLLFIQACRGNREDPGVSSPGIETDADDDEPVILPKLPTDADFLICYSAIKGYLSYRRYCTDSKVPDPGSWFVSALTSVFTECMQKDDLMQMMVRVNDKVATMATGGNDHVNGLKQMPCQLHMLTKRVMFGNH